MDRLETLLQFLAETPHDNFLLLRWPRNTKKGDDLQALYYYEQLAAANENYVGLYYHLGKLHERQGDVSRALAVYSKGMDVARNTGDRHALSELAAARLNLGDEF